MGKQVNFYMHPKDEKDFFDFVMSTGDVVILPYRSKSKAYKPLKRLPKTGTDDFYFVWLFNKSIPNRLVTEYHHEYKFYSIKRFDSSVIEFSRSFMRGKKLIRGRIWAEFKMVDKKKMIFIKKEPEFEKWYDKIARWIRKNYYHWESWIYLSPSAKEYYESGGKLA